MTHWQTRRQVQKVRAGIFIMIFHDAQEPRVAESRPVDWLEEVTGADYVISPLSIPMTEKLLPRHMQAGALLIQVKLGLDLASSLGARLNNSLARMVEIAPRPCQRALLFIGVVSIDRDGITFVDGRELKRAVPGASFEGMDSALAKWCDRGGVVHYLPRRGVFPGWVLKRERHLIEYRNNPEKLVYRPEAEYEVVDALQQLKRVKDWRVTLATFPGLGPVKVEALRDAIAEHRKTSPDSVNLFDALNWLTDPCLPRVKGFGPGIRARARAWLGLCEGAVLAVQFLETEEPEEEPEEEQESER